MDLPVPHGHQKTAASNRSHTVDAIGKCVSQNGRFFVGIKKHETGTGTDQQAVVPGGEQAIRTGYIFQIHLGNTIFQTDDLAISRVRHVNPAALVDRDVIEKRRTGHRNA